MSRGGSAMDGRADGHGRVYQAAGDQYIVEHHHHGGSGAPVAATTGIESVRRPTGGRAPGIFRDRAELFAHLCGALESGREAKIYVLHGMGGCGKTAVAHAVFQHATNVADRIGLWVNASDRASLRGGMLAVAADRGAEEGELLAARNGLRAPADLVWERLDASGQRWLLVMDNADDPAILQDGWLRTSQRGIVLVTTRQAAAHWWKDGELHHVGVLPAEAAAQVLCDLAPQRGTVEEAKAVADRLGRLPLALTLAGSFLAHQVIEPWTMAKYGSHLDGPGQVSFIDQGANSRPDGDRRGLVSRTWQLSLDALAVQGLPESSALLRLLACYGPDPLPLSLLGGLDEGSVLPRARADEALRGLLEQSLVTLVDAGVSCVQTHSLLLASVAAGTSTEALSELARTAVRTLDAAVPPLPERGPQDLRLRLLAPHALALLRHVTGSGISSEALEVAVRLAVALHRTGDYLSAWELAAESAATAAPVLGENHRSVMRAHARAGRALLRLGRFKEAEALLRLVLEAREQYLGPDDTDTLDSCYALNLALQQLDRGSEGLPFLRRALEGRIANLGPLHPLTVRSRSMMLVYLPTSELAAAIDGASVPLPQECAEHLGVDHDESLVARQNYALALFRLGRFDVANEAARLAAEEYERRYGSDYPVTFAARTLHARTSAAVGDLSFALDVMTDVAQRRERVLGRQHPHTVRSHQYLDEFRARAGKA